MELHPCLDESEFSIRENRMAQDLACFQFETGSSRRGISPSKGIPVEDCTSIVEQTEKSLPGPVCIGIREEVSLQSPPFLKGEGTKSRTDFQKALGLK